MNKLFDVQTARFHLDHPDCYVLQGYFEDQEEVHEISAYLGHKRLPVKLTYESGVSVRKKYLAQGLDVDREYYIWIKLPKQQTESNFPTRSRLTVVQRTQNGVRQIYRLPAQKLYRQQEQVDFCVDQIRVQENGNTSVRGWVASKAPCEIKVTGRKGRPIEAQIQFHERVDMKDNFPEGRLCDQAGFEIEYQKPARGRAVIEITSRERTGKYTVGGLSAGKAQEPSYLTKGIVYLKRNGFERTFKRTIQKLIKVYLHREKNYDKWRKARLAAGEELEEQRRHEFACQPLISIVVPLYRTPIPYLRELVASVRGQTYKNWELCLSDGSGAGSPLKEVLKELQERDSRIKLVSNANQLQISENTNRAIELAEGEFIAFADHDDLLSPDALYECVKALNQNRGADVLYTDEDKVTMDGKEYFQPHFKSDYNVDLLCSMNYICHLFVVKRALMEKVGALKPRFDGAQDYDFILRCTEQAGQICHIPKALYHWRAHQDSTAENPQSKGYAFEAGTRAVQAHYDRLGIKAVVTQGEYPGLYRTRYLLPDEKPMISIIIPNKDHAGDLDQCIQSVLKKSAYPNLEFVIVENNSTQEETFSYYKKIEAAHDNIHVLYWKEGFNYSSINNFGVKYSKGEYLLFLNNDTEIISEDFLEELLGPCMRQDVGVVGARLYYADDTIQHAGVVIGYGGIAGHAFIGSRRGDNGYFSRIICTADLSAVTAACMMVKRSVFEEAGGFDESLRVAFNDIDLCMKVRALDKLVVYQPYAEAYHYESKSRGYEDTPQKIQRFNKEADLFLKKWPDILKAGDPYYNVNLSLDKADFSLKA